VGRGSGEARLRSTARRGRARESAGSESELEEEERREVLGFYKERGGEGERGTQGRRKWPSMAINGGHNAIEGERSWGRRRGERASVSSARERRGCGVSSVARRLGCARAGAVAWSARQRRRGQRERSGSRGWGPPVGERGRGYGGAAAGPLVDRFGRLGFLFFFFFSLSFSYLKI
jgi:hypothetical protein